MWCAPLALGQIKLHLKPGAGETSIVTASDLLNRGLAVVWRAVARLSARAFGRTHERARKSSDARRIITPRKGGQSRDAAAQFTRAIS